MDSCSEIFFPPGFFVLDKMWGKFKRALVCSLSVLIAVWYSTVWTCSNPSFAPLMDTWVMSRFWHHDSDASLHVRECTWLRVSLERDLGVELLEHGLCIFSTLPDKRLSQELLFLHLLTSTFCYPCLLSACLRLFTWLAAISILPQSVHKFTKASERSQCVQWLHMQWTLDWPNWNHQGSGPGIFFTASPSGPDDQPCLRATDRETW